MADHDPRRVLQADRGRGRQEIGGQGLQPHLRHPPADGRQQAEPGCRCRRLQRAHRQLPRLQVEDRDLRRGRRLQHLQAALDGRRRRPHLVCALVVRVRLRPDDRRRRQDDADGEPDRAGALQGRLRPGRRLLPAPEDLYAKRPGRRVRIQVVPRRCRRWSARSISIRKLRT